MTALIGTARERSAESARRGLYELAENLKAERCRYNADSRRR